jgi:hypothetical protein
MEPRRAAEAGRPSPEAAEFVRFCYRRRGAGWPELYDEMCAVAGRGLFRGWGSNELAKEGIGFGLFDLPALAQLSAQVVAEEEALRPPRPGHRGSAALTPCGTPVTVSTLTSAPGSPATPGPVPAAVFAPADSLVDLPPRESSERRLAAAS